MLTINIEGCRGFSNEYRKQELLDAYLCINVVLRSSEFREEVMAFRFHDGKREFSSLEVYETLMKFERELILVRYSTWKWWSKVVGYVKGKASSTIYCNSRFWDVSSPVRNASFLTHESSHLAGYSHSSANARYSVPYGLNKCFERAAARLKYV